MDDTGSVKSRFAAWRLARDLLQKNGGGLGPQAPRNLFSNPPSLPDNGRAMHIPGFDLAHFITATLAEDLGEGLPGGGHDVTSESVIPARARFAGVMESREDVTVAGLPIAAGFFHHLDPECAVEILVGEGETVRAGAALLRVTGAARALLTAERSALNTVQHLTGIATLTRAYVAAMGGRATLLDTRKTLPGLRLLEKYATRMGGAENYRMGLWDAVMIKDNHIAVAGGVGAAVARAKAAGIARIICEVDRLDQIEPALSAGANHLLLDNMAPPMLAEAVALVAGRAKTEASGGVRLDTIGAIAASSVDYISVGRLMQSAPAADIGLDLALA
jgi:nicotinate-nucleotide pyrophosphorylase (carboxylating)